jgi:hypothetical protein
MRRVLIVGCPGAGKSTLAKELADITKLPVIHLDRHYWLAGWRRPDNESWQKTVEKLVSQPIWIMDGNYSGTLKQRLASADTLIHLDYPTLLCLWRVVRRTAVGWRKNRSNQFAPGCRNALIGPSFCLYSIIGEMCDSVILNEWKGLRGECLGLRHRTDCWTSSQTSRKVYSMCEIGQR